MVRAERAATRRRARRDRYAGSVPAQRPARDANAEEAAILRLEASGVLNPGEDGFDLSEQATVAQLAGGETIGVSVTTTGMLMVSPPASCATVACSERSKPSCPGFSTPLASSRRIAACFCISVSSWSLSRYRTSVPMSSSTTPRSRSFSANHSLTRFSSAAPRYIRPMPDAMRHADGVSAGGPAIVSHCTVPSSPARFV